MANLKTWIEDEASGEDIKAVVIGELGWGDFGSEKVPNYSRIPKGKVINWEEAIKWIDYEFNDSYGYPGCNAIVVWTTNKVISIGTYDGATFPFSIPRNPTDFIPEMVGLWWSMREII